LEGPTPDGVGLGLSLCSEPDKDFVPDEDLTRLPPFFNGRFRFNQEIFQWLLNEGKISPIDRMMIHQKAMEIRVLQKDD